MSDQPQIPSPVESDSDEVRWALETARSLWANDARESLRWLRRAAEAASDAGDDLRSVHLARAAADLRSAAGIQGSLPPPASMAPPPAQPGPAADSAAVSGGAGPEPVASEAVSEPAITEPAVTEPAITEAPGRAATAPAEDPVAAVSALGEPASDGASVADEADEPEPSSGLLPGQSATATPVWSPQAAVTPATAAAVPAETPPPQAAPVAPRESAAVETPGMAAPSPPPLPPDFGAPPPAARSTGPRAVQSSPVAAAAPAASPSGPASEPTLTAPSNGSPEPRSAPAASKPISGTDTALPGFVSHQALRVAFNPESDEFGQLLVRPLIEGEEAPRGWVTALLVGLEAGNVVLAGAE